MALTLDELNELTMDELFTLAIEESAEVIHIASKIKRFGPYNHHPNDPNKEKNLTTFLRETSQVGDIARALCRKAHLNYGRYQDKEFEGIDADLKSWNRKEEQTNDG